MTRININDVARRLSQKGYTIKDSKRIMADVVDLFMEILAENEDINLRGFGKFEIRYRNVYGDKPSWANQEKIIDGVLEGYPFIKFVPSKALKASLSTNIPVRHDSRVGTYHSKYNPMSRRKKSKQTEAEVEEDG